MSGYIKDYLRTCAMLVIETRKNFLPHRTPYKVYQAARTMERVHLDFMGPLPRTEDDNEYIFMMVDHFTKLLECVP